MKLSDVMSSMGLAVYAEVALVIFFAVFVGVLLHVYRRDLRPEYERARMMPLDDDTPQSARDLKENG